MENIKQLQEIKKQIDIIRSYIAEKELNKLGYELDYSEFAIGNISVKKIK